MLKKPTESGMLCRIDGETFHLVTKNTLIGDLGTSCHITNNDTGLYDINEINTLVQGSSGSFAQKSAKLMAVNGYMYYGP